MGNGDSKSISTLGFLTVVQHQQYGLFGGYLLLNMVGRPLEFHCTAPIKPNRAQEILYGPTLEGFLYGEQIGQTLVKQSAVEPLVVCTDCQPALAAREFVPMPLVLVLASEEMRCDEADKKTDDEKVQSGKFFRIDSAHRNGPQLATFRWGRNRLAAAERTAGDDQRQIVERLADLSETFDLIEPFQRIRDAIEEAQQAVR
jgi:hypothetical protein